MHDAHRRDQRAPYDSLNLGLHVGDDPDAVAANRQRLREQFELAGRTRAGSANPRYPRRRARTNPPRCRRGDYRRPGTVAVVMVADCLPILLCSRDGGEVAAVHAGWRGLQAGVVRTAVSRCARAAAD